MAVLIQKLTAATMTITTDERDFFIELGQRIAALRKVHDTTQVQLAEALGISQQTMQAYEVGRRRIPVSALPVVARVLDVSLEELFGESKQTKLKRGPASRLQQQIDAVSQLPKPQQRLVTQMLDAVLAQANQATP